MEVDKLIKTTVFTLLILIALDIGTTAYGIGNGIAEESNPISQKILEEFGLYGGLSIIFIGQYLILIFGSAYTLKKQILRKTYLVALIFSTVIRLVVVINNFNVII
jgi:hypothetical protein